MLNVDEVVERHPSRCFDCFHCKSSHSDENQIQLTGCRYVLNHKFEDSDFNPFESRPDWCPFNRRI